MLRTECVTDKFVSLFSRKQRVLYYLLSYVVAWNDFNCRISLLKALQDTHEAAKLMTLFPLLEQLSTNSESQQNHSMEYLSLLLAAYDSSAKVEIRNLSLPYWSTFIKIGKNWIVPSALHCLNKGSHCRLIAHNVHADSGTTKMGLFLRQAEHIFNDLDLPQKVEISAFLVEGAVLSAVRIYLLAQPLFAQFTL